MPTRLMTTSDKNKILALDEAIFGSIDGGWKGDDFDYYYSPDSCYVYYEEEQPDEPIGYIFGRQQQHATRISNFAVKKEHEGRGIGKELMKLVMLKELDRAADNSFSVTLQVAVGNERALRFYENLGYGRKYQHDGWIEMEATEFPELLFYTQIQNSVPAIELTAAQTEMTIVSAGAVASTASSLVQVPPSAEHPNRMFTPPLVRDYETEESLLSTDLNHESERLAP